jgi:ubiquinone biosynthesis protein Coq4
MMETIERHLTVSQHFANLKAKYHFMQFIKNPTDTVSIFRMAKSFQNSASDELVKRVMQPLLDNSRLVADYEAGLWFKHPDMKTLSTYPEGSFGRATADFFAANNLDENLFPEADFSSVVNYITSRVYQTHDFWHVLTGYSVGLEDEMALQAFGVGQYKQPISLTIIAGGIIHILQKHPERTFELMTAITEGYERGLKAKLLLDVNIFEYLDRPLEEVRDRLGIPPRGINRAA